jgi:hypothetical protein
MQIQPSWQGKSLATPPSQAQSIDDQAVTTGKIATNAVTPAKLDRRYGALNHNA